MDWLEYFLICIDKELYKRRRWVLTSFSITTTYIIDKESWMIHKSDDRDYYYFYNDENEEVKLTGVDLSQPPIRWNKRTKLKANTFVNQTDDVITCPGEIIINHAAFIVPYGNLVPYISGNISPGALRSNYNILAHSGELEKDMKKFLTAVSLVESFVQYMDIAVPAGTIKTLTHAPGSKELRDKLVEENKDEMDNPLTIGKITDKLVEHDKKYLSDNRSQKYITNPGKQHGTVRNKLHGVIGQMKNADTTNSVIVTTSLAEGIPPEDYTIHINEARAASISRGLFTGLGGYNIKIANSVLNRYRITEDDCGTSKGLSIRVTEYNYKKLVGRYISGKKEPLTEELLHSMYNKVIILRDPSHCKSGQYSICTVCAGKFLSQYPDGISVEAARLAGIDQGIMMKLTHGITAVNHKFSLMEVIS